VLGVRLLAHDSPEADLPYGKLEHKRSGKADATATRQGGRPRPGQPFPAPQQPKG
jgi:hypothetical protein